MTQCRLTLVFLSTAGNARQEGLLLWEESFKRNRLLAALGDKGARPFAMATPLFPTAKVRTVP